VRLLALLTPVELVRPGDCVQRPSGTTHVVSEVLSHPECQVGEHVVPETHVIVYVAHEEATYENKARDRTS
jgi:hypothetical protein